jgi:6-phosphogluconolactonase
MTTENQKTLLFVGTYTRPAPYLGSTNGEGIYTCSLDVSTGEVTVLGHTPYIDSPSFLAISPKQDMLYATSEVWLWPEGTITAYRIDPATGALTYVNKQPTLGSINAYASVDRDSRFVFVANYWDGAAAVVFPIRADGGVLPPTASVTHSGSGPVTARQDRSHAHCVLTDPANRFVYVADLGIDRLMIYRLGADGSLTPNAIPSVELPAGTGPRHVVFHPNGRFAYVIGELSSSILALSVNADTGAMQVLQSAPTLPVGVSHESSYGSDIQIHPSGRFLYGGNRGHDSLVIYAVDAQTGQLTYVGHQPTLGRTPRNFAIDPSGTLLLVGNQDSDTIATFRIDAETGLLAHTGHLASVPTPVCLKMIRVL